MYGYVQVEGLIGRHATRRSRPRRPFARRRDSRMTDPAMTGGVFVFGKAGGAVAMLLQSSHG